jgi:WD40 repeat protein
MVLPGHAGRIAGIAYSPVGDQLASIGLDPEKLVNNGEVKVWDTKSGREMWTVRVNASGVRFGHRVALAFGPDGRRLAVPDLGRTADPSCDVRVWDAATGRELLVLKGHADVVVGLAFGKDCERIVSGDAAGFVRLWDANTGRLIQVFRSGVRPLNALAYHPDGRRVALGGKDGTVSLWDVTTGRKLLDYHGLKARIDCVALNLDGTFLAAGSAYGDVKIWDTSTGREPFELPKLPASVLGMAFNPDRSQSRLGMSSGDGTFRLWDLKSMKDALSFRTAMNYGIAFSSEGRRLATALGDGTIRIVSAAPIESPDALGPSLEFHHDGPIYAADYSPDGARLATVEAGEGPGSPSRVRVRDAIDGGILIDVGSTRSEGAAVAFSPDGARLAGIDEDGSLKVRDGDNGRIVYTLGNVKAATLAYSPDGRWIAANDEGDSHHTLVVIWDAKTGRLARSLDAGAYSLEKLAFSPDGRRIAAISDDLRVRVWDAESGRTLWSALAHSGFAGCVAFSHDGTQLATGGAGEPGLKTWDSATGRLISILPGRPGLFQCIAYSPDGRFLASGSTDRAVRIWDMATGQEIRTSIGHAGWITGVSFSPDGGRLASSSLDGSIKIWDVTSHARGLENGPDGTDGRSDVTGRGRLR